jgi:hypothetical protein
MTTCKTLMESKKENANTIRIIKALTAKLNQYAPMTATHEGLENCELAKDANAWIEKHKK